MRRDGFLGTRAGALNALQLRVAPFAMAGGVRRAASGAGASRDRRSSGVSFNATTGKCLLVVTHEGAQLPLTGSGIVAEQALETKVAAALPSSSVGPRHPGVQEWIHCDDFALWHTLRKMRHGEIEGATGLAGTML